MMSEGIAKKRLVSLIRKSRVGCFWFTDMIDCVNLAFIFEHENLILQIFWNIEVCFNGVLLGIVRLRDRKRFAS